MTRVLPLLLFVAVGFVAAVAVASAPADDPPVTVATVTRTETVRELSSYQGRDAHWWAHRAVKNRREIVRLKRAWQPTVDYAIGIACSVFSVPCAHMHSVARCESHKNPAARNGIYRGVFQEGPMFERGPFSWLGPVWDPVLNALTAAWTVAREGWRQWECRP